MIIYTHGDCLKKFNGAAHPERKERLDSIIESIKSSNLKVEFKEAPKADLEIVSLVHPKKHLEQIWRNKKFHKSQISERSASLCFVCV